MRSHLFGVGVPLDRLGVPPCGRAYFLLLRQKKVAKEKATPGYAVGVADSPALLKGPGGCGTRPCGPQTVLAEGPRPFSVARRSTWGSGKASRNDGSTQEEKRKNLVFNGRPLETAKNHLHQFGGDAFRVPLGGAEQRRLAGGFGLRLSEPQASLASRPACRVAQGTGQRPAPTRGSPSSLATFFLAKQEESTPARKAEPSRQASTASPVSETPRKGGTPTQNKHAPP